VNGYCLAKILILEAYYVLKSSVGAFWVVIIACCLCNGVYLFSGAKKMCPSFLQGLKSRNKRYVYFAKALPWILAFLLTVVVGWSFFISGWDGFWGSANGDIFDGLYGRDEFLSDQGRYLERSYQPFEVLQYSSLAFFSILLRSFNE